MRAGKDSQSNRASSGGFSSDRGNQGFGGNFRGRTPGYNASRGGMNNNMNANNFNRNFSGPGMGNMGGGYGSPMGGFPGNPMGAQYGGGFNRGGMMGGMRGGPAGMRGGRGGMANGMMGGMPMGGMPMGGMGGAMGGMPMNMGQMGGAMQGTTNPAQQYSAQTLLDRGKYGKDHTSAARRFSPSTWFLDPNGSPFIPLLTADHCHITRKGIWTSVVEFHSTRHANILQVAAAFKTFNPISIQPSSSRIRRPVETGKTPTEPSDREENRHLIYSGMSEPARHY